MGDSYDVTLHSDDLADHDGGVALGMAPQVTITDQADNRLFSPYPTGRYESSYVIDNDAPTATIDGVPATDSNGFMATVTFSEPVTDFTASDVAVTNR